jgi:tetratricopeptide (TPR) repeat protein/transcriptional regulator with XRE-family HTH domain
MPDPAHVATREDFGRELTLLREEAGFTIRGLANQLSVPASTLGGYFTGSHLPHPGSAAFLALLRACGVADGPAADAWKLALRRARRSPGEPSGVIPQPDRPAPSPPTVSIHAPTDRLARQPRIQGRTELLNQLATLLEQPVGANAGARVHVLHGLGGCGKSTVALSLARQAERQGVRVWWVPSSEPGLLYASLEAVAIDLGMTEEQLRLGSLPDQIWTRLADRPQPWLLIFDDADEPRRLGLPGGGVTDGNGYLRPVVSPYGAVLLTTRNGSSLTWTAADPPWFRLHAVDALSADDGARVLLQLAGPAAGDADAARRLATRLGGLPLALRLAGQYLAEVTAMPPSLAAPGDPRTFDGYAAALDQGRHREYLDGRAGHDQQHREMIGRTWELSLDLLATTGAPHARPILRLLSCLRPAPIPLGLLRAETMASSPLFTGLTARRLWHSLNELVNVGLIDWQRNNVGSGEFMILHPLVREASRLQDDLDSDAAAYLAPLATLLTRAVRDLDPKHPSSWRSWSELAPHCASPLDLLRERGSSSIDDAAALLEPVLAAARYLRAAGQPHRSADECGAAIAGSRRLLAAEHPVLLALRHEQGRSWYDAGRYDQAKRELHDVLARRRRALGADHPDTATTAHYLGRVLLDHGLPEHAKRYFLEARNIRRRILGDRHPDTLTSLNNIAAVHLARAKTLAANGDAGTDAIRRELDLAEELLLRVLAARREILGDDHPATLVTCHHLCQLAQARGDLRTAENSLRQLTATSTRVLGPDHRRTLDARQSLADLRHTSGDTAEADSLTRQVLTARMRILGPDHPATLASQHRLALILRDQADIAQARALLGTVIAARRRLLGARHQATIRAAADLAALEMT